MVALLAAGGVLALAAPAAATRPASTVDASASQCTGGLYQVRTVRKHRSSTLDAIDPDTGRVRRSTRLDHTVNAIGYDAGQGLFVGVATRRAGHPIGDGGHIVTITPEGETRDLGPVGDVAVAGAYAGTAVDGHLLLLLDGHLVAVDVRPRSPTARKVVRRLDLPRLPSFGDWDARPGDGGLYAVTTQGRGPSRLVRIDPASGAVTETPVRDLPGDGFFGAVAFDDSGTHVYATDNNHGGALWRIGLDGTATKLARGSSLLGSDAAWCPHAVTPSPTPRPTPSPSPSPSPTLSPTPTPSLRPEPEPTAPPLARPRPPSTPSTAPPSPAPAVKASREQVAVTEPPEDDRTTTVRWGMVLLVLGLGTAARAIRRPR